MFNSSSIVALAGNIIINAINKSKMEKKQSSIEWAIQQISKVALDCRNGLSDKAFHVRKEEILEQAKAMHKEESELLFECGRNFQRTGEGIFNQAYNETFGGNNE